MSIEEPGIDGDEISDGALMFGGADVVNDPPPSMEDDGGPVEPGIELGDPNPGADEGKPGCEGTPGIFGFVGNPGGVNGVPGVVFGDVPPGESGASGLAGTRFLFATSSKNRPDVILIRIAELFEFKQFLFRRDDDGDLPIIFDLQKLTGAFDSGSACPVVWNVCDLKVTAF